MYFAGTDIIVKMHNAPYPVPIISSVFTFPSTGVKVRIEEGQLIYNTFDGLGTQSPVGFCSDSQYKTKGLCVGNDEKWTPYATLDNVDPNNFAAINLNAVHLVQALDDMVAYFETNAVNNTDFIALNNWVADIKTEANKQANFKGGIDRTAKLIDAVGIQINSQQPVSPLYHPGSPYMEAYMRSNTMIQGTLAVNYSGDNRDPAQTYFKGKPFKGFESMISTLSFMDDKTLASMITYNSINQRQGLNPNAMPGMEIVYLRDDFERYYTLNTDEYMVEEGSTTIQLQDVRFVSRNHSVSPSADNIVETYQFIARDMY